MPRGAAGSWALQELDPGEAGSLQEPAHRNEEVKPLSPSNSLQCPLQTDLQGQLAQEKCLEGPDPFPRANKKGEF